MTPTSLCFLKIRSQKIKKEKSLTTLQSTRRTCLHWMSGNTRSTLVYTWIVLKKYGRWSITSSTNFLCSIFLRLHWRIDRSCRYIWTFDSFPAFRSILPWFELFPSSSLLLVSILYFILTSSYSFWKKRLWNIWSLLRTFEFEMFKSSYVHVCIYK